MARLNIAVNEILSLCCDKFCIRLHLGSFFLIDYHSEISYITRAKMNTNLYPFQDLVASDTDSFCIYGAATIRFSIA